MNKIILKIREKGIKHIFSETLPWLFYDIFDKPLGNFIKKIYLNKPLKDVIIIESHNDFDSNGGAFFDYLIKHGYNDKYKLVWFLRNKCPKILPHNVEGYRYNRLSIKRWYYYCIAKYIICGHYMIPSIREEQKSYYTTHGAFGLKAFKKNVNIPSNINYILTPSEYLKDMLAKEYCLEYPNDRQIILGYPSHDILYGQELGDLHKITNKKYKKVILWMPTFRISLDGRKDGDLDNSFGIPIINSLTCYNELNEKLNKENSLLIVKIHPMQDMSTVKISSLSNIILLDGELFKKLKIDNYKLMKDADALISDYSSVAYDFLHLNRPIGYTLDDIKTYKLGLIVSNPKNFMAGKMIYNFRDLSDFIDDVIKETDSFEEERKKLKDMIWKYHDGKSSERLVNHMGL